MDYSPQVGLSTETSPQPPAPSDSPGYEHELHCDPQFDPIVRRVDQILLGAQVTFCRLNRGMPQQHLDLLKLPTGSAAHFRATTPPMPHAA